MSKVWNKGLTKETHASLERTSHTMRRKKIDNFLAWREKMKASGNIKSRYPALKKNGELAELIGVVLGDGTITKFPRTESLRIVGNWNNQGFMRRYSALVESVFEKKPHVAKRKSSNGANITIYERCISERIRIPTGAKGNLKHVLPDWISKRRVFVVRYLRGLYEAEGSHCVHEKTYTHKLLFSNRNPALLRVVRKLLVELGFHPHVSKNAVQISRKAEVQKLLNLLEFRRY